LNKPRSRYWQLSADLRPQWQTIAQAMVCTVIYTAIWPLLGELSGQMAKHIGAGDVRSTAWFGSIVGVVWGFQKIMQYGQNTLIARAALYVALALRQRTFAHLQHLSLSYFETVKTGDLAYRLTEEIDRIGEVVNKLFHEFIPGVLQLIVVVGYMTYLNWQLTLATLIVAPVMSLLVGWFGERLRQLSYKSQNRVSDLSSLLIEMFSGVRLVQAFAAESYAIERFRQEAERNRQAKYAAEKLRAIQFPVVGFLEALSMLFLLLLGSWQISQGRLTGASFVSYVTAVAFLLEPIALVANNYNEFKQGEASVDRIFELLAIQPTVVEKSSALSLPAVTGKVEFSQVSFSYQPGQTVLRGLDLLAQPGEMIALVGASGAGKTTLVNLIPRFYDPQDGKILVDGVDVRDVTLRSLRRQIGIVPQETTLFSGTIAENIAFGQTEFALDAVQSAAKIANAHQFISQFPQGYHTWVGERGTNLSGGQRQRLAIARAVLLNPRILILDEATSALDSESEALVQEALERIMEDRTVFVIAHRLATVRRVDRILVLEKGQVVEAGTHTQLIAQEGRYAKFYAQQFS
jgi:ATP-binding cassette, subfamily B, bacterial